MSEPKYEQLSLFDEEGNPTFSYDEETEPEQPEEG